MSTLGWLVVFTAGPPVWAFFGWLGRQYQRSSWLLNRPYHERVEAMKLKERR